MDHEMDLSSDNSVLPTIPDSLPNEPLSALQSFFQYIITLTTVFYAIIFTTGLLGNALTCIVIAFTNFMHTSTNYYLFNLAISDLIIIVFGLPLEIYNMWMPRKTLLNDLECVLLSLIIETAANVTVLTITAFTVERYIAVCHPFMAQKQEKLSRAVRQIIVIWVVAVCAALPQAMQFGIVADEENQTAECTVKGQGIHEVYVVSSVIFFVIPSMLMFVLYTKIYLMLRKSRSFKDSAVSREGSAMCSPADNHRRHVAGQGRIVKMLVAVSASFFFCWAPFHIQRLIAMIGKKLYGNEPSDEFYNAYVIFTWVSGILYYSSTVLNPLLYSLMSRKFRRAMSFTFNLWRGKVRDRPSFTSLQTFRRRTQEQQPRSLYGAETATTLLTASATSQQPNTKLTPTEKFTQLICFRCQTSAKTHDQSRRAYSRQSSYKSCS